MAHAKNAANEGCEKGCRLLKDMLEVAYQALVVGSNFFLLEFKMSIREGIRHIPARPHNFHHVTMLILDLLCRGGTPLAPLEPLQAC